MLSQNQETHSTPDPKILARIQKLLALSTSNFKEEAESALLKAQKLMLQHGVSSAEISFDSAAHEPVVEREVYHSQTPLWHGRLAAVLASNFRCRTIWLTRYRNDKKIRVMTFIGHEQDADVAAAAYAFAIALVKYNQRCIKKRFPRVTSAYLNTYVQGFIKGVRDKFSEQVKKEAWGLILVTPAPVEKHYEDYNSVPLKPRGRAAELSKNDNAFSKGYQDGKTFDPDRKRIGRKGNK